MKLLATFLFAAALLVACTHPPTGGQALPSTPSAAHVKPNTVLWAQGTDTYVTPDPSDGQCGAVAQSPGSAHQNFKFSENSDPNASTCYRSQINPTHGGDNEYLLTEGDYYTWTWSEEDTHNTGDPGMGFDTRANALVWQLHPLSYGDVCGYFGFTSYPGYDGTERMVLYDCTSTGDVNQVWSGTYTNGQTDAWRIDVLLCSVQDEMAGNCSGSMDLYRNGTRLATNSGPNWYDNFFGGSGANKVWWNFGPYKFFWAKADCVPPSHDNCDDTTMESVSQYISGMTLSQ